ncbi:lipoprotein LpqH [Corynebacterium sp. AOP40-9SA-29]|uniref:lipoprotein LpqH n=1 Tax=Corynebacterium sp. AOP40-9SA-29 TaxID=3457677 RepID=UPI004034F0EE
MNISDTRRRVVALALGTCMVGALAACGDDNDNGGDSSGDAAGGDATVTVTETSDAGAGTSADASGTSEPGSGSGTGSGNGGSVTSLVFDGTDMASQFIEVQCRQDGSDEFEIDLRNDDATSHVEVDLDTRDTPRVDGLGVEMEGKEWESTDAQEADATVEVDGDTYRVSGQVEVDDDHPDAGDVAELELEVSCV